jgi:DGQHR domain-containing protein
MRLKYIEVNQPIGTFYLTAINADEIAKLVDVQPRSSNPLAVQRDESKRRIKEIAEYCDDADATFPTPIIISVYDEANVKIEANEILIDSSIPIGEVIDGQHRLKGLIASKNISKFVLPVIFMFDLIKEQKAYVFSIINSKQTRVSMSLIYDLFDLYDSRSPLKSCHEIARGLNKDPESPYFKRLKMLGKKELNQDKASLSQGTFVKYLVGHVSKNPDEDARNIKLGIPLKASETLVLRSYFVAEQDSVIYKLVFNVLKAASKVFNAEWNNPDEYIISKSTGYGAIMKAFPAMYKSGEEKRELTEHHFTVIFEKFKRILDNRHMQLTSRFFPSNEQQQSILSNLIIEATNE